MSPAPAGTRPIPLETAADLERFVTERDPALVEFYTEGCGICASMEPVLWNVARTADVAVATINPRDDPGLIERYRIRSVPTLLLFRDGEVTDRLADGFQGTADVVAFVEASDRSPHARERSRSDGSRSDG